MSESLNNKTHRISVKESQTARIEFEFEIIRDAKGEAYLTIEQRHFIGTETIQQKLTISAKHFNNFHDAYLQAANLLAGNQKAYSISEIRQRHANAYRMWTETDDKELVAKYKAGLSVRELAAAFGRKRGAIKSRLRRLGCTPKHSKSGGHSPQTEE